MIAATASNAAEQLYVAVEDSAGRVAVVNHPDGPTAVQVEGWTSWSIDLSEFSNQGANLTAIKKMMIGVGNRANPTAGGAGQLFFDDMRVCQPPAQ